MKSRKTKIILWAALSLVAVIAVVSVAGIYYVRRHIPAELIPDIRAAIAARHETDPDARLHKYLEGLYGSLDDPANRERAFLAFFDANHIKAMQILVRHSPPEQRSANILAMARWISNYRQDLSPKEKSALGDYFATGAGQSAIQNATAQFMNQDAVYRSATVPVITELMTTLNKVRK